MIQDDFGNLVEPTNARTINERLDAGDRRMAAIEIDLAANTRATQELAAAVQDVVNFFSTMKGAFKALDMLGKLAKPMGYIVGFLAGAVSLWLTVKAAFWGGR